MLRGSRLYEYVIMSKRSAKYLLIRVPSNCSLMRAVMKCDAKGDVFEVLEWNKWDRLCDSDKLAVLSDHTGWMDPPKGEEKPRDKVQET